MLTNRYNFAVFVILFYFLSNIALPQNSFKFKLCNNEIDFNISKDNILASFSGIYTDTNERIKDIVYLSLEKKTESDFYFCKIIFSFFKAKLYKIDIQNSSDQLVSNEISELASFLNKVGEVPNEIDELDVYNNTIIYQKGNLKLSMTDYMHFTFCTIKDITTEKEIKKQYPDFEN